MHTILSVLIWCYHFITPNVMMTRIDGFKYGGFCKLNL